MLLTIALTLRLTSGMTFKVMNTNYLYKNLSAIKNKHKNLM